jgi:hypothetical protein
MNNDLINKLVETEWHMFSAVQNIGGPASCQSDRETFEIMRKSQFEAWSDELLSSYKDDLEAARSAGRNLLTEKYGRMMEHVFPLEYAKIASSLPPVSDKKKAAAARIARKTADAQAALAKKYPLLIGRGRPIYAREDTPFTTSLETYMKSELLTYSEKTLSLLKAALGETDLSLLIMENTVRHYGYASLEEAEKRLSSIG